MSVSEPSGGPSWLGIGAQRSGTTWFTDLLTQHPQVGLGTNGKKEQHLLHKVADGVLPAADYLSLFPADGVRRGEWTPQYLRHASVPAAAARHVPDAPVLVLLRDPVERFRSAMRLAATRAAAGNPSPWPYPVPITMQTFTALPYRELGAVALGRAQELGAGHADFRFERIRHQHLGVRDGVLQTAMDADDVGFAVRVVHRGAWGFASGVVLTPDEARRVAETAVQVAEVAAEMTTSPVEIAPEPVYADVTWVSSYDVNPFDVPIADKAGLLIDWTERLRQGAAVDHATASVGQVLENKYYADLAGTVTTQQRVRVDPEVEAMGAGADTFDSMRSIAYPVGRGWEYLTTGLYDWDAELDEMPELLAEKLKAPTVEAGRATTSSSTRRTSG